jgi:hypothetical protein
LALLVQVGIYYHLEDGPLGGKHAYESLVDDLHR